jgi:hypothetical protein
LALVDGLRPENELEAAVAVHQVAMDMLSRMVGASNLEHKERYANLATKLQRTMGGHIEVLNRLRRGPEPSVGQVNVNDGGQAIVGTVTQIGSTGDMSG